MKKTFKRKSLSIFLSIVTLLSTVFGSIPVMAAETIPAATTESTVVESLDNTQEAQKLRGEIDKLLAKNASSRETYKTDYWGYTTVYNEHTGGNHTIYGHRARMCVAYKPLDGNTALSCGLSTSFWGWTVHYWPGNADSDGYCMYVGEWKDITYMGSYRMNYQVWTTGNGGVLDNRRAAFHVWVDYQ